MAIVAETIHFVIINIVSSGVPVNTEYVLIEGCSGM